MQDPELKFIKQVGPKRAEALNVSGIKTILDLLTYFPRSYIDRTTIVSLDDIQKNLSVELTNEESLFDNFKLQKEFTIIGEIINIQLREIRPRKKILLLTVRDLSNSLGIFEVVFFRYVENYRKLYTLGALLAIHGTPTKSRYKTISFIHPEINIIDDEEIEFYTAGGIIPKYKLTDEMRKTGITHRVLRQIINNTIELYIETVEETLPEYLLEKFNFPSLKESIKILHAPGTRLHAKKAMNRIKFEELFYYQLYVRLQREKINLKENGIIIKNKSISARRLYDALSFKLTPDQKKVLNEVAADFANGKPMNRLLQGDVGSGKTIVSVLVMLMVIDAGYQVVMMAPTELLAEQHFHSIKKLIESINMTKDNTNNITNNTTQKNSIEIVQLTGGMRKKNRQEIIEKIKTGEAHIIVGTHALFQKEVQYNKLGLVVIDEQHRFGVVQRAELIKLAKDSMRETDLAPHILYMTATPIPRTLTMTVYGDLDVSIIKTMPKDRLPIRTYVTFESHRNEVYKFISNEIFSGRQAYIVFPLVEKSEKLELKSAVEHYKLIQEEIFPQLRCGLIHGQMLWQEKEEVMRKFLEKEYDILIATTVIEVGIDVPNATVILIEDAERFGLAQLHQLRGRVGRSSFQSHCFLMTKDNFQFQLNHKKDDVKEKIAAIVRLRTMQNTSDGFEIAEADMKLRGPGDIMGVKQAGLPDFKYADLVNDIEILSQSTMAASSLILEDNTLSKNKNLILRENIQTRYGDNIFLTIA